MASYAYVSAYGDNSLTLLDVTNPAPAFKSNISGSGAPNYLGGALHLAVSGTRCYVLSMTDKRLAIFDISNPAAPSLLGSVSVLSGVGGGYISLKGNYCYISDTLGQKIYVVDVTDPALPSVVYTMIRTDFGLSISGYVENLYAYGNYLYVCTSQGAFAPQDDDNALHIINISNPLAPVHVGSIAGVANYLGRASWPFLVGNFAYISAPLQNGLTIINISNPASPSYSGRISGSGAPNYLKSPVVSYVAGNYAYVPNADTDGLTILDISNPVAPTFVSNLALGAVVSAFVKGTVCYVCDGISTIYCVDISNPAVPSVLGSISGAGSPNFLGNCFFAATGSYPQPPTPPTPAPGLTIDFKGLLDCIGWSYR